MARDYYIIIGAAPGKRLPYHHKDWESALAEQKRLRELAPDKHFRIYRCKRSMLASNLWPTFEAYVRAQAAAGCLEARDLVAQLDAQRANQPNPDGNSPPQEAPEVAA